MRAGTKRRFNPGEMVVCTDEFRGDRTLWNYLRFDEWVARNGIAVTKLPSRRRMLLAPYITLRLPAGTRYADATGPQQIYATGCLCAIRIMVPATQEHGRTGFRDTHLYVRRQETLRAGNMGV